MDGHLHTLATLCSEDFIDAMVDKVNHVMETTTRQVYHGGSKVTKDKIQRTYHVGRLGATVGATDRHTIQKDQQH